MLVMTWWIGPHAYGLFITAIGIVAFLAILARGGIDTYLVRSEAPDARMYGTAAALVLTASIGLGLVAAAATPLFIRWYGSREFVPPYLAMLAVIPVSALTGLPMARLERNLDFRRIAGIELAGQSLGLVVAASLAWLRVGVWAPVMGQIVWQVFTLIAACVSAEIPYRLCFDLELARPMLSYGVGLTASLRAWQLRTLVNPLIVGRFVGAEGVAYVALAIRIAEALGSFRLAAGRMAIAALARLQDRRDEFRRTLEQSLYLQVVTLGPLLCGFVLLGPYVVRHIIGPRWMPSILIYPFAAAGVLVNSVYNLQASALFVVGKQWLVMKSYVAHVVLLATTTLVLLPRAGPDRLRLCGVGRLRRLLPDSFRLGYHRAYFIQETPSLGLRVRRGFVLGSRGLHPNELIASRQHHRSISMPTIAYLANLFPSPVEPYVVDEIRELRRLGITVFPYSARGAKPGPNKDLQSFAAETIYFQPLQLKPLLCAAWLCVAKLSVLAGFFRHALFQGREPLRRRLSALPHTLLGAYYAALLQPRDVEHIHVHHGYFGSWVAMVAARLLGVGFSMTLHGSDLLLDPVFLELKLKQCRFCVNISEFNRRHILTHYPGVAPGKILVRRLGVEDPESKHPRAEKSPVFSI